MTRRAFTSPRRALLAARPPLEPPLTPATLAAAPELAVLALLDDTLAIARLALVAAHPTLLREPPPWRVTNHLRAATRLLRAANALDRAVALYRRGVLRDLRDRDPTDDIPF